jgi:2-phospho-L-lactate guanylyltransferase
MNMLWALVPLKRLARSKQRLGAVLDAEERKGLMLAMARDVLTVIRQHAEIDGVLLVSRAPEARKIARECEVELFCESAGADLSQALTEASRYVVSQHGASATLVIPSDVPMIRDDDIAAVLAQHDSITVVPDNSGEGTNALLLSPPGIIAYAFGEQSFRHHTESSSAAGVTPIIVKNLRMSKDIDVPDDLVQLRSDMPQSATRDFLQSNGLA